MASHKHKMANHMCTSESCASSCMTIGRRITYWRKANVKNWMRPSPNPNLTESIDPMNGVHDTSNKTHSIG